MEEPDTALRSALSRMFITLFSTSGCAQILLFFPVVRLAKSHLIFPLEPLWNLTVPHFPLLSTYCPSRWYNPLLVPYLDLPLTFSAVSLSLLSLCTIASRSPRHRGGPRRAHTHPSLVPMLDFSLSALWTPKLIIFFFGAVSYSAPLRECRASWG